MHNSEVSRDMSEKFRGDLSWVNIISGDMSEKFRGDLSWANTKV